MKIRVLGCTVMLRDDTRRAINLFHGKPGIASRQEAADFYATDGVIVGNLKLADVLSYQADFETEESDDD